MSNASKEQDKCPQCGNHELARIGTYHEKYCLDCNLCIQWWLKPGQTPIYGGYLPPPEAPAA